jgi:hypothetical protein
VGKGRGRTGLNVRESNDALERVWHEVYPAPVPIGRLPPPP